MIIIISDTHGITSLMNDVISKYPNIEMVIHLGDCVNDVLSTMKMFPNIRFEYVAGNNDYNSNAPLEKIIEYKGNKIFITHGHKYGVKKSMKDLANRANSLNANVAMFGHTHIKEDFMVDDILFINPGALGGYVFSGVPSYCELFIEDGKIKYSIKSIN